MKISDAKFFSQRELVMRLKTVTMLQDKEAHPYKDANIQTTDINTDQLSPAQLYVLKSEFEKVRALRWAMQEAFNVDILRMADTRIAQGKIIPAALGTDNTESLGYVEFVVDNGETITILPPIIEAWKEADKSSHLIINDGMHRCYLARASRIVPAVVRIDGIPPKYPYYAFPLAGGWSDVSMVIKLLDSQLKKFHRVAEYKKLYRDFNSAFTNVGGPRGTMPEKLAPMKQG